LLGARMFDSLEERIAFVKGAIERRHAKALRIPEWKEAEVEALGRGLRDQMRGLLFEKQLTLERISYAPDLEAVQWT